MYAVAEQDIRERKVAPTVMNMLLKYIIGRETRSADSEKLFTQFSTVHTSGRPLILRKKSLLVLNEFIRHHRKGKSSDMA